MNELNRLERFDSWLEADPGRHLAALEAREIGRLLPARYFPVAVQFGALGADALDAVHAGRKFRVASPGGRTGDGAVASDFHALPFGQRSIDLALLPHTLDMVDDPHALLRELTQAMVPDGHILISGFQPYSLWGLRKWLRLPREQAPWSGHFFSTYRIQDWLSLMGFAIRGGKMLMYRPPLVQQKLFERLRFMEKAGDRWWPMLGGVYIIHAQLETLRMVPNAPAVRRARFKPRLAQPAARRVNLPMHTRKP
ncbi:MAG: methyltransferase domain-containing protein [Proteobacteria bacterium]|nr:MAG: methyltransferase domain-containing protein [Pseudomonadota bacterium]